VILQAEEIQILFSNNIWIFLPLPSLICALIDYQVQERNFEYSCHRIFCLLFLESQRIVSPPYFYNNVHVHLIIYVVIGSKHI
jgi:hypothetical protein